ncbi:unnamed protein product [Ixodes hexagonus]
MENPRGHRRFDEFIACVCSHCELVSPEDIKIRMERVKRTLWDNGADLNGLCSAGPNTVCWLLDILCPWNAILYKGGLGLHEEELGRLTCKTRAVPTSKELFGTEGNILEAAYLLYRLCGQHRCLQRLVVKEPCPLRDRPYWGALMKLSLQASKGLRSVEVVSTLHEEGTCCVLEATPMAPNLREIKCSIHLSHEDSLTQILQPNRNIVTELILGYPTRISTTEYLFSNLEFCTSLKRLQLNVLEVDVGLFMHFMINNKTITHLSLSQVFPATTNMGDGVAYLIKVNRTLEVLHLRMRGGDATSIARSMCDNTTLRTLSLAGFENLALSAMAEVLLHNDTLLELSLSAQSLDVDVSEMAAAVVANNTLQKLCLRTSDVRSTLLLVGSLEHNSTLLSLNVGAAHRSAREELHFKMAVLKPWALGRVVTKWVGRWCLPVAWALYFGAVAASLDIWYVLTEQRFAFLKLQYLCDSLRINKSVRSLTLCVVPSCSMDEWVAQKLGLALYYSETLETVKLSFVDTPNGNTMRLVCEGLKMNSSIFCIKIMLRASDPSVLKYMAAVLEHNRVITSLNLNVESLLERRYLHTPRSVLDEWTDGWSSLSKAIETSRDLLEAYVSVKGPCVTGFATDFALTVQRNLCALQRAVRFVLKPTTNKRAAEMFQDYEDTRELFRRVERSAASYREAYDLIQSASNFIDCHFFVVTGIVQRTLQCEQANRTTTRLDDLSAAGLCRIASFLRVTDVKC